MPRCRKFARLEARTRRIRVHDLHTEDYVLTVLDEKSQRLQIAARTPPDQSARLAEAYAALFDGLNAELAEWIQGLGAEDQQEPRRWPPSAIGTRQRCTPALCSARCVVAICYTLVGMASSRCLSYLGT
jgi:hypothetical protein